MRDLGCKKEGATHDTLELLPTYSARETWYKDSDAENKGHTSDTIATPYEQDEIRGAGMIPADLVVYLGKQWDITDNINNVRCIESTSKERLYVVQGSGSYGFHGTIKGFTKNIKARVVECCES